MNVQERLFRSVTSWVVSEFFYFIAENIMDFLMNLDLDEFILGRLIYYFCFSIYLAYNLFLINQVYQLSFYELSFLNFFVFYLFIAWLEFPPAF